jgi:hypothetical protein
MLEELNAGCASTGVTVSVHNSLVCSPLVKWGTEEQKQRYFPKLRRANGSAPTAFRRPAAGSDAAALVCEAPARRRRLDPGRAEAVDHDRQRGGAVHRVRTHRRGPRRSGISAFLVEREYPGVGIGKKERKLGIKASPTSRSCSRTCACRANLLGEEGRGFKIALDTLDGGRLGICVAVDRHRARRARGSQDHLTAAGRPQGAAGRVRRPTSTRSPTSPPTSRRLAPADGGPRRCATAVCRSVRRRRWPSSSPASSQPTRRVRRCEIPARAGLEEPRRAAAARCAHHRDLRGRHRHAAPRHQPRADGGVVLRPTGHSPPRWAQTCPR